MNIKVRLSFQFTLLVAGILLFFSALVYYFSYSSQISKFRQNLLDSAKNTATLFIDVAEVDSLLLKKIQQSTTSWEKEELAITDSAFNLVYGNNIEYLADRDVLVNSSNHYINYFSVAGKDGVSYKHINKHSTYYVFSMAVDKSRAGNLAELRKILFWSIIFSIWLSVLFSYFFATRAIKPITNIIKSVKEINSLKLNTRLDEGDKKDEIAQLAITFNEMLSDLEIAFRNQEDFVSNASHELRTPLTVMKGESDYILSHERSVEDYINHIQGINADLKNLNELINNLLELAQITRDKSISITSVRIDEIVYNAIFQIKNKYPGRKIVPRISYPENEDDLLVGGNEGLLSIAFSNLLDNACKFSEGEIPVGFTFSGEYITISISDEGVGIPAGELRNIQRPFSRASNVKYTGGFGIGLSLVARIISLHNAGMKISSAENRGTTIDLVFRKHNRFPV